MLKNTLQNIIADQQLILGKALVNLHPRDVDLQYHLRSNEISVVTGVRRCGKSSLLKLVASESLKDRSVLYCNFDDPRLAGFLSSDFESLYLGWQELLASRPKGVLICFDEIQNISAWERWAVHFAQLENHKVFVTGSNAKMLSSELATHLTGRHVVINLMPFSFKEIVQFETQALEPLSKATTEHNLALRRLLEKYKKFGGFPKVYLEEDLSLLSQYFRDIILNDIALRKNVRNEKLLLELGNTIMTQNANLTNKSKVAKDLGIRERETVVNYFHYFEETFLAFEIRQYAYSLRRQQRSLAKFYSVDPALARHCGFQFSEDRGALLEHLVFLELRRRGYQVYYWKSAEGYEVDFVVKQGNNIEISIQVCSQPSSYDTVGREVRALLKAKEEIKSRRLLLISEDPISLDPLRMESLDTSGIEVLSFIDWALE
ncbi:MAG: ATP-binding protein [Deltaproteobacteria bacterium]|nr:ATP-binding protein [Deltaproteobacteria bacterium]